MTKTRSCGRCGFTVVAAADTKRDMTAEDNAAAGMRAHSCPDLYATPRLIWRGEVA